MKKIREFTNWIWLNRKTAVVKEQESQAKQLWLVDEFDWLLSAKSAATPFCVNSSNLLCSPIPEMLEAAEKIAVEFQA